MSEAGQERPRGVVSRIMRSNKSSGTLPEVLVRRAFREAGFPGYRANWATAPGKPDIAYPGRGIAVFVHGCFWHACPTCAKKVPAKNSAFWRAKLEKNQNRDMSTREELARLGWSVYVIWECEAKRDASSAIAEVARALRRN